MGLIKEYQGDFKAAKEYVTQASQRSRNRKVVLKFGSLHSLEGKNDWASRLLLKFAEQYQGFLKLKEYFG
jgi:hypothetical protein